MVVGRSEKEQKKINVLEIFFFQSNCYYEGYLVTVCRRNRSFLSSVEITVMFCSLWKMGISHGNLQLCP